MQQKPEEYFDEQSGAMLIVTRDNPTWPKLKIHALDVVDMDKFNEAIKRLMRQAGFPVEDAKREDR